jgi:toxin ParE1/3/4
VPLKVVLTETAIRDLQSISDYFAEVAGEDVAATFDVQLKAACASLADFPRRGRARDEIRAGLRTLLCARTFTIFYSVADGEVEIVHVIHARRDLAAAFEED